MTLKGCQQRIWPPAEGVQEQEVSAVSAHNAEATFRHPLPPGIVRPRLPITPAGIIRQQQVQRMPGDVRLQGLDPRMRMLLQQQQQQQLQQHVRKPVRSLKLYMQECYPQMIYCKLFHLYILIQPVHT